MAGFDEAPLDCGAGGGSARDALNYRIGGLFGIFLAGIVGFILPVLARNRFKLVFFLFQTFAAGVVLGVGIVHVLPEATDVLQDPCLGLSTTFPWAPVIALFSALLTFIFEHSLRMFMERRLLQKHEKQQVGFGDAQVAAAENGLVVGHHGATVIGEAELTMQNRRVVAYTLEVGIVFHSIFIGLSFGTSHDATFVKGLAFALLFHQGFEGIALGSALSRANVGVAKLLLLGLVFVLTCPLGVAAGIAAGASYNGRSVAALGTSGGLGAVSAGVLLYNGFGDLLLPAFLDRGDHGDHGGDRGDRSDLATVLGFVSLLAGAACMSLIAKWA